GTLCGRALPTPGRRPGPGRRRPALRRPARARPQPVRDLRARAVLHDTVRLLRLHHLHRRGTGPGRIPRRVRGHRDAGAAAGPARARRAAAEGRDRVLRRRHADAAARRPPRLGAAGDRRPLRPGARGRGDHRGQPGVGHPGLPVPAAGGRLHPGLLRDAVGVAARAAGPGPPAHPRAGGRGGRRGAARRVRPRQPGPDLRHAGRGRGGLAAVPGHRGGGRPGPRLGVRAGGRGGHRDGPPGRAGRAAGAGRRRAGRPVRPGRRDAVPLRLRLVRGLQLGPRHRRPLPAQPALLDRRRLVGRRAGRAQPRRRGALVERAAPGAVRVPAARRGEPGGRPGDAGAAGAADGDDDARAAAARGAVGPGAVGARPGGGRGRRRVRPAGPAGPRAGPGRADPARPPARRRGGPRPHRL
ncbi:MAG: Hypothetical radical SAM family enzyme in heat shock gene cluster, similarity with CPO of BS HemN-type, partial [uncultured Corynebacteriales bacterium]